MTFSREKMTFSDEKVVFMILKVTFSDEKVTLFAEKLVFSVQFSMWCGGHICFGCQVLCKVKFYHKKHFLFGHET